jgi:purine nucleoside phosphorylase
LVHDYPKFVSKEIGSGLTFPALVRCRELGLRAAAVSCITNNCCRTEALSHSKVIEAAQRASGRIVELIRRNLCTIDSV